MTSPLLALTAANLHMIVRDRILHGVLGFGLVMLLLVPSLSSFSMRQMQEVSVTLSLSGVSLVLLVVTLLLGTSSIWRDVERRYTASILTLPVSRVTYLLAKYFSIALFLVGCALILAAVTAVVILIAAAQYPSDLPIAWGTIALAIAADVLKYLLLAAAAILLSAVSTSFFLPFFGTLAIYLAGSASQEVYEYVTGQFGQEFPARSLAVIKGIYYLLPNFAAFNFKVHAVYVLPVTAKAVLFPCVYAVTYTGLLLGLAVFVFNRRELP
jgi:ABC-type transport system involved in multi-copper enzyme maturation permease subunit